ncbi:MAG: ABC transporter ATP-binding protein [Hydrogenophaga sp.]|nr:ABC transporter ATP-binding protein [Hydrogenophaga sp.]
MSEALRVRGLVKRFGGLLATDHADLTVLTGQCHALIGPNGAGKTTLIHQISGSLASDAGSVCLNGQDVTAWPMHRRVRAGLVRSYQITSVFQRLSVQDNLALALQPKAEGLWGWWTPARADRARFEQAAQWAERVGLSAVLGQPVGALSHGQQRQLEVAMALATEPSVVLLDEPMAGMGPDESQRMLAWLQSIKGQVTLLLVEHDMDAVFALADTVSVLVAGRVMATGSPHEVRQNPEVKAAYLGDEWGEAA